MSRVVLRMALPEGGNAPPEARAKALAATLARTLRRHAAKAERPGRRAVSLVVATEGGEVEIDLSIPPIAADDACRAELARIPGLEVMTW